MKRFVYTCLGLIFFSGTGGFIAYETAPTTPPTFLSLDRVSLPKVRAKGVVFLLSDASGWGAREAAIATKLQADGIAVVGVDTPQYLATISHVSDSCAYLVADVERISQQLQRESGSSDYVAPIVSGIGLGGGLALDMVDQTPNVTVGGTAVADPVSAVPFGVELCTPAGYLSTAKGQVYALPKGPLVNPISVSLSPNVAGDIHQRIASLQEGSPDVTLIRDTLPTADAMTAMIERRVDLARSATDTLPVTILNTAPKHDAMAIILSGDGGWRDIDSSIGKLMQADGVPVVGIDSLRYFWSPRTPQQTAKDLATLIRKYRASWSVNNVILIGYSFGADVLPATYLELPQSERNHIRLVSLLGLSSHADWQITVSGWLGSHSSDATPTLPATARMQGSVIQCVNGIEVDNAACAALGKLGADIFITKGGHHFGGEYRKIETAILAAYARRINQEPLGASQTIDQEQTRLVEASTFTPPGPVFPVPFHAVP